MSDECQGDLGVLVACLGEGNENLKCFEWSSLAQKRQGLRGRRAPEPSAIVHAPQSLQEGPRIFVDVCRFALSGSGRAKAAVFKRHPGMFGGTRDGSIPISRVETGTDRHETNGNGKRWNDEQKTHSTRTHPSSMAAVAGRRKADRRKSERRSYLMILQLGCGAQCLTLRKCWLTVSSGLRKCIDRPR